MPAVE
jgi:hypothetical protein